MMGWGLYEWIRKTWQALTYGRLCGSFDRERVTREQENMDGEKVHWVHRDLIQGSVTWVVWH